MKRIVTVTLIFLIFSCTERRDITGEYVRKDIPGPSIEVIDSGKVVVFKALNRAGNTIGISEEQRKNSSDRYNFTIDYKGKTGTIHFSFKMDGDNLISEEYKVTDPDRVMKLTYVKRK